MSIKCLSDLFYRYLIPIFLTFIPPLSLSSVYFKPILNVFIFYFSLFFVFFLYFIRFMSIFFYNLYFINAILILFYHQIAYTLPLF